MTGRIRWEPVTSTTIETGHVGTYPVHAFVIYSPNAGKTGLTLTSQVSACRFCNALLRRSDDGLYADIDLNRTTNPEPWQCSGRYVASPGGRHKPIGTAGDKLTEDGEPR